MSNAAYLKERREWLHSHHLCVDCKQEDAYTMVGKYRCAECSEKARIRKTGQVVPKQFRGELGLCVNCGGVPVDGLKVCEDCRRHMKEMSRISHKDHGPARDTDHSKNPKLPRSQWVASGFCYLCGEKADRGVKVCKECRSRLIAMNLKQKEEGRGMYGTRFSYGRGLYGR